LGRKYFTVIERPEREKGRDKERESLKRERERARAREKEEREKRRERERERERKVGGERKGIASGCIPIRKAWARNIQP